MLVALLATAVALAAVTTTPAGAELQGTPIAPAGGAGYGKGAMDTAQVVLSTPDAGADTAETADDAPVTAGPAAGTEGWTTVQGLLPGTQMVALSWDGPASEAGGAAPGTVSLRSRTGGTWGAWTAITADPADQGGEGAGRVGTEVVWLGADGADAVEIRVDDGPLVGLELLKMRYTAGERLPDEAADEALSSGGAARPTIRPRSDWASGGWKSATSGCGSGPVVASSLKHVVVHHTASTNSYTAAQVPGLIDGIYQYHTASLGWCDIAYNFLVDQFGTIWQGRTGDVAQPVVGGHAMGFNTGSVGVSLLGQFEPGASPASGTPTTAMLDSTARLIAWKLSLAGLDPNGTVAVTSGGSTRYTSGTVVTLPVINYHQMHSTTACPGANVISRMPALRAAVAGYMSSSPPPTTTPPTTPPPTTTPPSPIDWSPFASGEALVWRQYSDLQRNPGTYVERKWWIDSLNAGTTNRNALVASLLRSSTVDARSAAAMRLYLAYFGRIPDHAGIRYWWDQMDAGMGIRRVSALFTGSPEFKTMYGPLDDAGFVRLVYRNVMGREAEAAGVTYWVGELRAKRENRGGVMVKFTESAEYKARKRTAIEVMLVHETMLGRAISSQSHAQWVARVDRDGIGSLISAIYSSPEYAARVR